VVLSFPGWDAIVSSLGNKVKIPSEVWLKEGNVRHRQRLLSLVIDEEAHKSLLSSAREIDRARLLAVSMLHATDWLNVIPNKRLGLYIPPLDFQFLALWFLGETIFTEESVCVCSMASDRYGHHAT